MGGMDVCNGYTTQLLPSLDGTQLYELVNVGCSIEFAAGPMDNAVASGIYTLISKNSNLALDVAACSNATGANVQQWTPTGGDREQRRLPGMASGAGRGWLLPAGVKE